MPEKPIGMLWEIQEMFGSVFDTWRCNGALFVDCRVCLSWRGGFIECSPLRTKKAQEKGQEKGNVCLVLFCFVLLNGMIKFNLSAPLPGRVCLLSTGVYIYLQLASWHQVDNRYWWRPPDVLCPLASSCFTSGEVEKLFFFKILNAPEISCHDISWFLFDIYL